MGVEFKVNSRESLDKAKKILEQDFEQHKYTTYSCRYGKDRSLTQNALLHVWCLEYGCYITKMNPKEMDKITKEGIIEGTKRSAKGKFYRETGNKWMVLAKLNTETLEFKKDFRSSSDWKRDEMFEFLTWFQAEAAHNGLTLESKGEFNRLQKSMNA